MNAVLLIFTFCLISDQGASSKEVTGYTGGGVLIKCKYDPEYTPSPKLFCRWTRSQCSDLIKTEAKNIWVTSGRFSLFDDVKSAEFWVMIRELAARDAGTYQCVVHKGTLMNVYTPVELKVKKGIVNAREVIAYAGTRSNIKCRYEDQYKGEPKSFLKIETNQCSVKLVSTEANSEWSHDGRFSIHDNRSAGFFSVFIRELITEDTGTYACGVAASDETEIYTLLNLNVTQDTSYEKSISKTVYSGGDLTISCKYPEFLKSAPKFLCKRPNVACLYSATAKESRKSINVGKVTLYDDRENQIFSASIKDMTERDPDEYWCGAELSWALDHGYKVYFTRINVSVSGFPASSVIAVSAGLLALLIGIAFLVAILRKRRKFSAPSSLHGPETVMHTFTRTHGENEQDSAYQCMHPARRQPDPAYENASE